MNHAAITKAKARLAKATAAVELLEKNDGFQNFESDWTDFLNASNTIYTSLEQGAKDSPQSRQWFGRKKRERSADPLLQYIQQARNVDEHGLERVISHADETLDVDFLRGFRPKAGEIKTAGGKRVPLPPIPDNAAGFVLTISRFALIPVVDRRYGTKFETPKEHAGKPFTEGENPLAVARAALIHQQALIAEAAAQIPQ